MPRAVFNTIFLATCSIIALASSAHADPSSPPCPSGVTKMEFRGALGPNSTGLPHLLNMKPCETVAIQFDGSASTHPYGNASIEVVVRNNTGQSLATRNFLCGTSCSVTVPLAGTVPGYPLPGTRGDGGLPHDIVVNVGVFNFFGRPPANYKLTVVRTPRTGYNTAGNSIDNALDVVLPATQLGSVHPFDPGQFVRVRLEPFEALYASGHVKGHPQWGAYWEIKIYDANGVALTELVYGTAYGGPHQYASRAFTNTAAEPREFYLRFWCRFWPVHDWSMNLVSKPAGTEITEVGFFADHKIRRWKDKFWIDPEDGTMPTWVKGRRGNQEEEYPASYTRNVKPTVFGRVSIQPPLTVATTVSVRIRRDGTVLGTKHGLVWNGDIGRIDALPIEVDLEEAPGVRKSSYEFDWEMSRDGGTTWLPIGRSGKHRIYWTHGTPSAVPFTNLARATGDLYEATYDEALKEGTEAAGGSADVAEIRQKVNRRLRRFTYEPWQPVTAHPLEARQKGRGQCADFAHLLRGVLLSLGIPAETWIVWGGAGGTAFWYVGPEGVASMQVDRPGEDGLPEDLHFKYHAITAGALTELLYDPSYGLERPQSNIGVIETLDAVDGQFVTQPSQVKLQWTLEAAPGAPQTANRRCDHARFGRRLAGFVDQSLPESMTTAQSYQVTVTFRNTGDEMWTTADGLALMPADAETAAAFGPVNVALPTSVVPDQEVTFTFPVTAALAPGSYNVSFQLQQNAAPFGAPTAQVAITVE